VFPLAPIMIRVWLLRAGIPYREVRAIVMPGWLAANAEAVLSGGGKPVLMIHSIGDPVIPPEELRRVTDRAPVEHRFVDAQGHSSSEQDPAFWETVLPFLERHLDGSGRSRRDVG